MQFSALQVAQLLGGSVEGNPEVLLSTFDKIETAKSEALTFLANLKYAQHLYTTQAGAVLVARDFELQQPVSTTLIRVDNPYAALAQLMQLAAQMMNPQPTGIEQPCFIAPGVEIPEDAYVGAFAYIGEGAKIGRGAKIYPQCYVGRGAHVGNDTILYSGVKVYHGCRIGERCILHSGAVIGADGFGFAPGEDGKYSKIPQLGVVEIGNDVEIGANTTIDRATMGKTSIGQGTKMDNLIQVAHNVTIGEDNVFAAQTGVAGSASIGSHNMIGGQVGIAGHIAVGNKVQIGAQSGIHAAVADGSVLMGYPAQDARKWMMQTARLQRINEVIQRLNKLEKEFNTTK